MAIIHFNFCGHNTLNTTPSMNKFVSKIVESPKEKCNSFGVVYRVQYFPRRIDLVGMPRMSVVYQSKIYKLIETENQFQCILGKDCKVHSKVRIGDYWKNEVHKNGAVWN